MPNLALPALLGLFGDEGSGSGDFLSYMMLSQMMNGEATGIGENKRLQTMFLAPLAKKFITRLAKRIVNLPPERMGELFAGLIAQTFSQRTEGDMASILDMAAMSALTSIFNSSGIVSTKSEGGALKLSGEVGGEFKGVLRSPREEVKNMAVTEEAKMVTVIEETKPKKKMPSYGMTFF